jgi:hypothetical protein
MLGLTVRTVMLGPDISPLAGGLLETPLLIPKGTVNNCPLYLLVGSKDS